MADTRDPGPRDASRIAQAIWSSRGIAAWTLRPLSWLYALVTGLRRALYAYGWRRVEPVAAPVIVVGNWIVGGAGKTPTTIALIELLRRHGYTPGVVSRGYGRSESKALVDVSDSTPARDCGDEPLLIRRRTGAPVVVGRARAVAARALLERHARIDIIVSDDGLQHLALPRAAQVVVFDERGAGNGWTLPAGPLREPLPSALPPNTLVLYNADAPTTPLPGALAHRQPAGFTELAAWHAGARPSMAPLDELKQRGRVFAAAGMARPQRFFEMLRNLGLQLVACPLPDHHDYATLPWPASTADVIVTEKDAVKLDPARVGSTRVWVATLDFAFTTAFETELLGLLRHAPA